MKVLYHMPSLASIYAHRTIYYGFKNAFADLGHEFRPLTADDDMKAVLEQYEPDLFMTSSHFFYRKFLNFDVLKDFRKNGLFVLTKVDFWDSPMSAMRLNEALSLKDDKKCLELMRSDRFGDAYFHVVEPEDERMKGFEEGLGIPFHTIPLAADKMVLKPERVDRFKADISYIGSALPEKRQFFSHQVNPLGKNYQLKIYGQDWTRWDRTLGWVQRAGQYFNLGPIARIRKPKLQLEDEAKIYASSVVSINVHEEYQRKYGGDCNERTFKIPLCDGFEVVDEVKCIHRYFAVGKEIVVGENPDDWVEKVHHYIKYPEERHQIIAAGKRRVLKDHTYHNRVHKISEIMNGGATK